ncbi:MAG TPA: hypothetical protein VEH31_19425 [Streptosporangiaceae bacterium]|nr:hypothetical protein [Streptosporangiaceae bacterium]
MTGAELKHAIDHVRRNLDRRDEIAAQGGGSLDLELDLADDLARSARYLLSVLDDGARATITYLHSRGWDDKQIAAVYDYRPEEVRAILQPGTTAGSSR